MHGKEGGLHWKGRARGKINFYKLQQPHKKSVKEITSSILTNFGLFATLKIERMFDLERKRG